MINAVAIDIYAARGNIVTAPGNVNLCACSYLNTVGIVVRTHLPSGNINTVPLKLNLYTQSLSKYGCN